MILVGPADGFVSLFQHLYHIRITGRREEKVGNQSWCWTISFDMVPALILPGQRASSGNSGRRLPVGVLLAGERRRAAIGPGVLRGPLSVGSEYITKVLSAMPSSSR